jgi:hypothetical protein
MSTIHKIKRIEVRPGGRFEIEDGWEIVAVDFSKVSTGELHVIVRSV